MLIFSIMFMLPGCIDSGNEADSIFHGELITSVNQYPNSLY